MAEKTTSTPLTAEQQQDLDRALERQAAMPPIEERIAQAAANGTSFGMNNGIRAEWQAEIDESNTPSITPIQKASLTARVRDNAQMKTIEENQESISSSLVRQLNIKANKRWWQFWK